MAADLDVYRDWLKIDAPERPLNHYQLLRLKLFEDNAEKIRGNYRKLNAHVRKYATGEYEVESQALLNELAKAMLCLTDAARKEEYDHSLGRQSEVAIISGSMQDLLTRRGKLNREQLAEAEKYSQSLGMPLHQAVVQKKLLDSTTAMQFYAESQGVPFLDLTDIVVRDELLEKMSAVAARQHSCVPVLLDEGRLLIAAPHLASHELEDELSMRWSMPVSRVLCTAADVNRFIDEHYPRTKAEAELRAQNSADNPPPKPPGKAGQLFEKLKQWVKENSKKK